MMAHSTRTDSLPADASPQSPARAVARRVELVRRLCAAGHRRCDEAFQRRVEQAAGEADAALAACDAVPGETGPGDIAGDATDRLDAALRALDPLTFELCED